MVGGGGGQYAKLHNSTERVHAPLRQLRLLRVRSLWFQHGGPKGLSCNKQKVLACLAQARGNVQYLERVCEPTYVLGFFSGDSKMSIFIQFFFFCNIPAHIKQSHADHQLLFLAMRGQAIQFVSEVAFCSLSVICHSFIQVFASVTGVCTTKL